MNKATKHQLSTQLFFTTLMILLSTICLAQFGGGDGTENNPYQIETAEHLDAIRGNYLDAGIYFIQTQDINLDEEPWNSGRGWTTIGNNTTRFRGNYDGDGYIIDGLFMNNNLDHQGLFGYTDGATIANVHLRNINVKGKRMVGGIVGYTNNETIVTGCSVEGNIKGTEYIAGIAGYARKVEITNSYVDGFVEGTTSSGRAGGIGGYLTTNSEIRNCFSIATVQGVQASVGGLAGHVYTSEINNSYCAGTVIAVNETNNVGGLVGWYQSGTIRGSYWDTETTGRETSAGGGFARLTRQMMYPYDDDTFVDWDFDDIWIHDENGEINNGYPALYFQVEEEEEAGDFGGGDGTAANPWQIDTAEHLNAIREDYLAADNHFIQTANIDLGMAPWNEGQGWMPLSNNANQFKGTYNGNGFVIKGVTINRNAAYQSLFGCGNEATITNVRLDDVDVMGGSHTGAIFGQTTNSNVKNCRVIGNVKGTYSIGGIIGTARGGTIEGCCVSGKIAVPGTNTSGYIGGIIGNLTTNANITNCYSTALVQGNQLRIGGLAGSKRGTINNSYCTGAVIATNETQLVGGIVGEDLDGAVTNSFWNIETTGRETSPGGGTGAVTSQMIRREIYQDANWEFPNNWNIVDGETYPFLAWEGGPSLNNNPGPSLTAEGNHETREVRLQWNITGEPVRYNVYINNTLLGSVNHPTRELVDREVEMFVKRIYYVEAVFVENNEERISALSNPIILRLTPPYAGGDGSVDNPYQVANGSHLDMIRYFPTAHFVQTADIDLSGNFWTPIGGNNASFQGSYDGDGFVISGMSINTNDQYQGLFGYTEMATFRNIVLEDVNVRMGALSGVLVGWSENTNISNVSVTGIIQAVSPYVGGLVGFATKEENTISNCSVSGTMTSSTSYIGGLMGHGYITINDCWTDLEITTTGGFAGGLVGSAGSEPGNTLRINRCAVLGNITSTSTTANLYLGGIIGQATSTHIEDSYVTGNVISNTDGGRDYVGGLIGAKTGTCSDVLSSYAMGNVTGRNYVGGLIGAIQNTNDSNIKDCYTMGTITGADYVGGLIGSNNNKAVLHCYSTGRIFGNTNVGGLIGSGNGVTTNSYWNTVTSGQEESPGGGEGKTTAQMTYPYEGNTYQGWDFETMWRHDNAPSWNDGYPTLHYQESPIEFVETPQLKADIVQIDGADHFRIRWELVEGARSYRIFSSDDCTTADWGDPVRVVREDVTTYTEPIGENKVKYFYVTASTQEIR